MLLSAIYMAILSAYPAAFSCLSGDLLSSAIPTSPASISTSPYRRSTANMKSRGARGHPCRIPLVTFSALNNCPFAMNLTVVPA
ncbi:hypothetical protein PF010_g17411 [Phytophthora fragariae]|uniref:Secreted protein n=1 Tax=Phytophthora fragariae TaxID=53985 RepID=A0A6A3IPV5_9STRA|nr:hypothetical protein PF011_g21050 [Phytophthora fragariae]KAE9093624.1 hypothetical protein PF010_g17411 [Phytophthora fragariae]KAE9206258.1 hypothetical protein PF004_g17347 [Phytophthora fragariae]KAE9312243.1 hypothetical protein PF008_g20010 [Phytophthora fragariae]